MDGTKGEWVKNLSLFSKEASLYLIALEWTSIYNFDKMLCHLSFQSAIVVFSPHQHIPIYD